MTLKNKTVVVTGSSSGIGRAIVLAFAKKGANVVITCKSNTEGAKETQDMIKEFKVKSMIFTGDLSNEQAVKELFKSINESFSTIDILVNNAGDAIVTPFMETNLAYWKENIERNLYPTVLCSKEVIPMMNLQRTGGKIINTASINGLENMGRPDTEGYSAAKAAVINFTKTIAKAYAPKILINAVAPGKTHTRHYDKFSKEYLDGLTKTIPVQRFLSTQEVAEIYVNIAENDGICGEVIVIDGGLSLKRY